MPKSIDAILDEVFAARYPGWSSDRLRRDPEQLPPMPPLWKSPEGGIPMADPRVPNHPALKVTNRKRETIAAAKRLAAQGYTRKAVAEMLGVNYTYLCSLVKEYQIEFRRAPWGSGW